jgi:hypothetical protein
VANPATYPLKTIYKFLGLVESARPKMILMSMGGFAIILRRNRLALLHALPPGIKGFAFKFPISWP